MNLSHIWVNALMELKRIYNDKRRVLILIFGPVIICLIFGAVSNSRPENIAVTVFVDRHTVAGAESTKITQLISDIDHSSVFSATQVYSYQEAMERLQFARTRAVIVLNEGPSGLDSVEVTIDVTDHIIEQTIATELPHILSTYSQQLSLDSISQVRISPGEQDSIISPFAVELNTNEMQDITFFDLGASGVIVLFVIGISMLMSTTTITSERTRGTIERIFASPYRSSEITLAKMLANTVFSIVVIIVILLTLKIAFDIVLGNIALVFIIAILTGINAIAMGILISAVTYTELESVMGAVFCWFLALILMGYTWPLETMHPLFTYASKLIPYSYAIHSMRNVNLIGWDFTQSYSYIGILCGFIAVQIILVVLMLRREIR